MHHYSDRPLRWLGIGIVLLLLLHLLGQFVIRIIGTDSVFIDELVWRFNVDLELNVPTWYASFLAGVGALLAFFIAGQSSLYEKNKWVHHIWVLFALILLFVAIDETASFHELLLQNLHIQAGFGEGQSYNETAWLILVPFLVAGGASVAYATHRLLPRRTFGRFVVAASVYLLGALVVEYASIPVSDTASVYNFVLAPLEEGLEMVGLWLLLRAMVLHVREQLPQTDKKLKVVWPR